MNQKMQELMQLLQKVLKQEDITEEMKPPLCV